MCMSNGLGSRLDRANIELAKELLSIKFSLDTYKIIGLNASRIAQGKAFFGHVQRLSQVYVALGLSKIYEREKRHELCSVPGIHRLARDTGIRAPSAAGAFARQYGVEPSSDWAKDVEQVFAKQQPVLKKHLKVVDRVRITRIAHLQQDAPTGDLPSIAAFEELLAFAVAFHAFVNDGFISTSSHPILTDGSMSVSLITVLKSIGISDVRRDFEHI
jgi:hypothetical protein